MLTDEALNDLYSEEWCRRRARPHCHILDLLRNRELEHRRPGCHFIKGGREFFHCVQLERTCRIEGSSDSPIRFTPNGNQLICFNYNYPTQEIRVFWYNGANSVGTFANGNITVSIFTCNQDFKPMLTLHFAIPIQRIERAGVLVKDFCLVTDDSVHLIVAFKLHLPQSSIIWSRIMRTSETVLNASVEDTQFLCINLNKGVICDVYRKSYDTVNVIHGVSLIDRMLGILSVQNQTITLLRICAENGVFEPIIEIGSSLYEDDNIVLGMEMSALIASPQFTGFRQRFMSALYRAHRKSNTVNEFLRSVQIYRSLRMHRMQFLGPELLLIRMDFNVQKDEGSGFYMFVIYDWKAGNILGIYNRTSKVLFNLFVEFSETFRYGSVMDSNFPSTMEHCPTLKEKHENVLKWWSRPVSPSSDQQPNEANLRRKILNCLPYSSSNTPTFSPILDPQMFSFDERTITLIERFHFPPKGVLKIFSRLRKRPVIEADFAEFAAPDLFYRLLFHPFDPLLIISPPLCSSSTIHIFSPKPSEL